MRENSDQFVQDLTASQNSLYGYILSLLPDRAAAQDVLQEVSLTARHKRGDLTPGTSFLARASKIAYFHVLNHPRKVAGAGWSSVMDCLSARPLESGGDLFHQRLSMRSYLEKLPAVRTLVAPVE